MEAFLKLLADRKLDLRSLVTHRFPIARANSAYDLITGKTHEPFLGVLIAYPERADETRVIDVSAADRPNTSQKSIRIGILGAGSFATSTLLPAMKRVGGIEMIAACAVNGSHARHAAKKFAFRSCTTDDLEVVSNPAVNTVVITTRHHLHAAQVIACLLYTSRCV